MDKNTIIVILIIALVVLVVLVIILMIKLNRTQKELKKSEGTIEKLSQGLDFICDINTKLF